jgi:hypothetical protein
LTGLLPRIVLAAEGVAVLVALELGALVARAVANGAARIVARTTAAVALTTAEPISSKRMERPMEVLPAITAEKPGYGQRNADQRAASAPGCHPVPLP